MHIDLKTKIEHMMD